MATPEGKPETKQQESKPEAKPEAKETEEQQDPPLKYKAWVLKVSIHCEGCKRKVEKTLRKIEGVYEVHADLKQQKATIKANLHVDAETLIKKLIKKGRHAELWPEKAEQKEKKQGKSKNKDKQSGQPNSEEANNNNNGSENKEKETVKNEVTVHQEPGIKNSENGGSGKNHVVEVCNVSKAHEGGSPCKSGGGAVKEAKPEHKQTVTVVVAGNQSPVAEKKGGAGGESDQGNAAGGGSSGGGGGGSGSKKNKKKGQKGNSNASFDEGDQHSGDAGPAFIGSHFPVYGPHGPVPMPSPANHSPPRQHHVHEHPTYYHAPLVYVTSYNTAYPSSSYTASYYASPPPYSYTYMHPGPMSEHPPSDFDTYSPYSSHPSDSFEMFSDENPNACSVM